MPPDPPSLACLVMHTYKSDINVALLQKILATGLLSQIFFNKTVQINIPKPLRNLSTQLDVNTQDLKTLKM